MSKLIPPLFDFLMRLQETIHGADRTEVLPFVQKGGVDLVRSLVHKPLLMEKIQDLLPLFCTQSADRRSPLWGLLMDVPLSGPQAINAGPGNPEGFAGRFRPNFRG
jgi:hypothetical protein